MCAVLMVPMGARGEVPTDSLPDQKLKVTTFRAAAGGGDYGHDMYVRLANPDSIFGPDKVRRDILLEEHFFDTGIEVDYPVTRVFHIGLRSGYIFERAELSRPLPIDPITGFPIQAPPNVDSSMNTFYFNPFLSFEWSWVGFGAGLLRSTELLHRGYDDSLPLKETEGDKRTSGHARLGKTALFYVSWHKWEGVPIYSGGGQFMLGAGTDAIPHVHLWAGKSAKGPYRQEFWMGRIGTDLNPNWLFEATYRLNNFEDFIGIDEWGLAFGLTYRHFRS
jgi:hypothetical protein